MGKAKDSSLVPAKRIEQRILFVRGQKVILDRDLAFLYGVSTKALNQAVKRNSERFPDTFVFRLTKSEAENIHRVRSQFVTLSVGQHFRYLPYVFTEHGSLMAANVLNSTQAIAVSIQIVETFIRLRTWLMTHKELAQRNRKFRINPGEELNTVAITSITRIQQFTTMPENMKDGNYWFQKLRRPGTAHETLLMYLPLDGKLPYGKPLFQIVVTNYDMSFLWEGDLAT